MTSEVIVLKGRIINPSKKDVFTEETARQIVENNCRLDYQEKYCKATSKTKQLNKGK